VREDPFDYRGLHDGGDDLELAAAIQAAPQIPTGLQEAARRSFSRSALKPSYTAI